jgi:hypothetical protein
MDPSKFQASTSGKVIRLPQGYWAFVPAALPPALTFSPSLVAALSDADRALGELYACHPPPAHPAPGAPGSRAFFTHRRHACFTG